MERKPYKTLILLILSTIIVLSVVFSLFSCGEKNREYNEVEVLSAAEALIKNSERLNVIYWGEGILYSPDLSLANGVYYAADVESLSLLGVSTVEDIKNLTRATFTERYAESAINTTFSSISDEDGIKVYARYYQKYTAEDNSVPECIMVNKNAEFFLKDKCEYDYSTLAVDRVEGQCIFVKIAVKVTDPDGNSRDTVAVVGLIEEQNGFRINTPTYKRYDVGPDN